MKELRNNKGELTGYETTKKEIEIHGHINYPDQWLLTIRPLEIFGRPLYLSRITDIEIIKDKVYEILDSKEILIETLKKLLTK
jgi:hypothetical protein